MEDFVLERVPRTDPCLVDGLSGVHVTRPVGDVCCPVAPMVEPPDSCAALPARFEGAAGPAVHQTFQVARSV